MFRFPLKSITIINPRFITLLNLSGITSTGNNNYYRIIIRQRTHFRDAFTQYRFDMIRERTRSLDLVPITVVCTRIM